MLICLLLIAGMMGVGFGPPVMTDGHDPAVRFYPEQAAAMRRLAQTPPVSATAALVMDADTGAVRFQQRPHVPQSPASTVKLMTALVVRQRADLAAPVTVSAYAASFPPSRMGLVAGETLTVRDLLYGLLIPSGNDAAVALAEHVGGSEGGFVELMNQAAAELRLAGTHFANPHGLDEFGQNITASDLLTITRKVLADPLLAQIVSTRRAQVAGRSLENTNQLLSTYIGADGVKTGTTSLAGECLVASVMRNGHRLLVVILGSSNRYADARVLLDYALAGWQWQAVGLPADALAWAADAEGQDYRLRATESRDLYLPAWQWPLVQPVRVLDATAPLTSTAPVGSIRWMFGRELLATVPLVVWQGP